MNNFVGFTKFPNMILDRYMKVLTGAEYKLLSIIVRKTVGYQKTVDRISISQFMDISGLSNKGVTKGIKGLVEKGLVIKHGDSTKMNAFTVSEHVFTYEKSSQATDSLVNKSHKPYEKSSQKSPETYEETSHTKETEKEKRKESVTPARNSQNDPGIVARHLYEKIQSKHDNMNVPKPSWSEWEREIKSIFSTYNCSAGLVINVINWALTNDFWGPKIHDAAFLKKKFQTLKSQMDEDIYKEEEEAKFLPKQL
jgi:phage replication O-like protein O